MLAAQTHIDMHMAVSSSRVVTLERESGLWPLSITERSLLRRTRSFLAKLRVHMEARLTLSFSVALSVRRPHITADWNRAAAFTTAASDPCEWQSFLHFLKKLLLHKKSQLTILTVLMEEETVKMAQNVSIKNRYTLLSFKFWRTLFMLWSHGIDVI